MSIVLQALEKAQQEQEKQVHQEAPVSPAPPPPVRTVSLAERRISVQAVRRFLFKTRLRMFIFIIFLVLTIGNLSLSAWWLYHRDITLPLFSSSVQMPLAHAPANTVIMPEEADTDITTPSPVPDVMKENREEKAPPPPRSAYSIFQSNVGNVLRDTFQVGVPSREIQKQEADGLPQLEVTGIMWDAREPMALVNGKLHKKGDLIQGARIVDIHVEKVLFSYNDEELTVILD